RRKIRCRACRQGESRPARDHEFVGIPSPSATILAHQPLGHRQHRPNPGASTHLQGREPGRAEERKELSHHAPDSRNPTETGIPVEPEISISRCPESRDSGASGTKPPSPSAGSPTPTNG